MSSIIAVSYLHPAAQARAAQLAERLGLALVSHTTKEYPFLLLFTDQHLEISPLKQATLGPVFVDFLAGRLGFRRARSSIKNELLAKAVGIKGNKSLHVLDATAGLGCDSFTLACLGCQVQMLERSPIISALLQDGLQRLNQDKNNEPLALSLLQSDTLNHLNQLTVQDYPEVIYLDPMYPHRSKSALVKKEMRIVREFVGDDQDADQLLALALQRAKLRVVVKRPRTAPTLSNRKVDITFSGKQHRFDVYLMHKL